MNRSYAGLTEQLASFVSCEADDAFFVLAPNAHFRVVYCSHSPETIFQLPSSYSTESWFTDCWPNAAQVEWQGFVIRSLALNPLGQWVVPRSLLRDHHTSQIVMLQSMSFQGQDFIACIVKNSVLEDVSESFSEEEKEADDHSYQAILSHVNEPMGLFELDEKEDFRILWLNKAAYKYVQPIVDASGLRFAHLLPDAMQHSWSHYQETLISAWETVSCCFIGDESSELAWELSFTPVSHVQNKDRRFIGHCRDITRLYQHDFRENRRKQEFINLVECSPDLIVRYNTDLRRIYINKAFEQVTGANAEKALGKRPTQYSGIGKGAMTLEALVQETFDIGKERECMIQFKGVEGELRHLDVRSIPEFNKQGNVEYVMTISRDVTEKHEALIKSHLNENRFRTLVENSPDYICRYDLNCRLIYANPATLTIYQDHGIDVIGLTPTQIRKKLISVSGLKPESRESVIHSYMKRVIATGKSAESEIMIPMPDGDRYSFVSLTPEFNQGEIQSILVIIRDLSEVREYQEQVRFLSRFDALTGLANRESFLRKVHSSLSNAVIAGRCFGLLVMGIDHFKSINESLGYDCGDVVLKTLAQRLLSDGHSHSFLARLGGDEFGCLLQKISDREHLQKKAEELLQILNQPMILNGKEVLVSVSVGACLYPDDVSDADSLIRYADSALLAAKKEIRGKIRFYSEELTAKTADQLQLRQDLRLALKKEEFDIYLQPKVDLKTRKLVGAEALVRWNHPERGVIYPDNFISIAEDIGLIYDLDLLVLKRLCEHIRRWQDRHPNGLRFAVNLSGAEFRNPCLPSTLADIITQAGCQPELLEMEITEGVLLDNSKAVEATVRGLKEIGLSIALDDFGTGYSSLSYLSRYPIDTLKIDRSFVDNMSTSPSSRVLVNTIVSMAKSLNMGVVAEGVETEEQASQLLNMGVSVAQGYLYDKPMPIKDFEEKYLR